MDFHLKKREKKKESRERDIDKSAVTNEEIGKMRVMLLNQQRKLIKKETNIANINGLIRKALNTKLIIGLTKIRMLTKGTDGLMPIQMFINLEELLIKMEK